MCPDHYRERQEVNSVNKANNKELAVYRFPTVIDILFDIKSVLVSALRRLGTGISRVFYAGFTSRQRFFSQHKVNSVNKSNRNELVVYRFPTITDILFDIKSILVSAMGKLRAGIIRTFYPESTSRQGFSSQLQSNALPAALGLTVLMFRETITNAIGKSSLTKNPKAKNTSA